MDPPCLDHHAGFGEGIEDLAVEQLVAELRVEALAVAVPRKTVAGPFSGPRLPGTAGLDERRLRSHGLDPAPHRLGDELIRASPSSLSDRTWPGTPRRMNRSVRTSITAVEFSFRSIRMARAIVLGPMADNDASFPGELVDDIEHPELPPGRHVAPSVRATMATVRLSTKS